ncbi:MAG: alpha/beta fold hydrolase [Novosphingobium sp.]|nr:alpha/beta fold hydrolase [Novosphingobium sp.]MCP5403053.1 alpha/beta fold hydrolase [Novosphingobium sp.]
MAEEFIEGFGGARLAVHRVGSGRPVLLLHGLFSSAEINWIKFGTAAQLAEAGFEAIMPDLRAHGASEAPHDAQAYPEDVLVRDLLALVEALGLTDYDLGGFSLGARTAVRGVLAGLAPRRLVLGGMGIEGLGQWARRSAFFVDAIDRFDEIRQGDPAWLAKSFMKTMNVDRVATRLLLGSVDDTPPEALSAITMPTLVVCGADDQDNGSAPALAEVLPDGTYAEIPGNHMSSVTEPEMGEAIVRFLTA